MDFTWELSKASIAQQQELAFVNRNMARAAHQGRLASMMMCHFPQKEPKNGPLLAKVIVKSVQPIYSQVVSHNGWKYHMKLIFNLTNSNAKNFKDEKWSSFATAFSHFLTNKLQKIKWHWNYDPTWLLHIQFSLCRFWSKSRFTNEHFKCETFYWQQYAQRDGTSFRHYPLAKQVQTREIATWLQQ